METRNTSLRDERPSEMMKEHAIDRIGQLIEAERQSGKSDEEIKELLQTISELIAKTLQEADEKRQFSYKGKDGKDYYDSGLLADADSFYKASENRPKAKRL